MPELPSFPRSSQRGSSLVCRHSTLMLQRGDASLCEFPVRADHVSSDLSVREARGGKQADGTSCCFQGVREALLAGYVCPQRRRQAEGAAKASSIRCFASSVSRPGLQDLLHTDCTRRIWTTRRSGTRPSRNTSASSTPRSPSSGQATSTSPRRTRTSGMQSPTGTRRP